ncbi:hypothetical protein [Paenibacillus sp. y28]|uniref:hypothetical protein n=1 Tax=Paenibacillus sp. y28 TaxID=3129110 RepID=UPI003015EBC1
MLNIVMLDEDVHYMELFAAYARSVNTASGVSVHAFSQKEKVLEFMAAAPRVHILLVQSHLLPGLPVERFGCVVLLSEHLLMTQQLSYPAVYKYQPLNQLMNQTVASYTEQHAVRLPSVKQRGPARLIAFSSASGGSGVTTVALQTARLLAEQGDSVFYLNLELLSSTAVLLPAGGEHDFSECMYYVKAHPNQSGTKLTKFIRQDPAGQFDYIQCGADWRERQEMTAEELQRLLKAIQDAKSYDAVLIDIHISLTRLIPVLLEACDRFVWLASGDTAGKHRSKAILDSFGAGHSEIIINRSLGNIAPHLYPDQGFPVTAVLPFVREWMTAGEGSAQLRYSAAFTEALQQWLDSTTRGAELMLHG